MVPKLYAELDVERESSATANEALSMILRLQTEKATLKMEASQYKRLSEQKIGHGEESLAILEELIYQKEMETSSLEFEVQAYRYKLSSIGFDDLNDFQRNDTFDGEKGIKATVIRLSSLPVHDSSSSQGLDSRGDSVNPATGDFNSYLEQIIIHNPER